MDEQGVACFLLHPFLYFRQPNMIVKHILGKNESMDPPPAWVYRRATG